MSKLSQFKSWLEGFERLDFSKYGPDFLRTWDKDKDSILGTQQLAQFLRDLYYDNVSASVFNNGLAISIFRDKSTRTKYSFSAAANYLGLEIEMLDESKSQISHGETVMETANMLSFLTKVIGIRDDKFLGVGHAYQQEVVESVEKGFQEGILAQRPSVINLQCDEDHPTQSLSDFSFLVDHYKDLENLKGKKLVMSWAYSPSYGKPMSVPQGIIALLPRFGVDVTLAYPEGYNLISEIEEDAAARAKEAGAKFEIVHDMKEAFKDADIVYPKSWAPYSVMAQRTQLLKNNDDKGLEDLEQKSLADSKKHVDWTCTEDHMKLTKNGKALYMHCLPADITGVSCKEGEVDMAVFDKYRNKTYVEASYKPYVIAAMMLLGQYGTGTAEKVRMILDRDSKIM